MQQTASTLHFTPTCETFYAHTDDNWSLALHYFPGNTPKRKHPILFVHGFAGNRTHFHLDTRYSLATAAAQRGFDAYILELRGAGLSKTPGERDRSLFQWGFNDYAHRDLPTAIATVFEKSKVRALHGVGHSMGGMLFYAVATQAHLELRSITAIGSPLLDELHLANRESRLLKLATSFALDNTPARVPLRKLLGAASYFVPIGSKLVDGILFNASNLDNYVIPKMARAAIADVPIKLILELKQQIEHRTTQDNPYTYEQLLHQIKCPVFAVAGVVDRIAPAASVRAAVRRMRSADIRYREMGRIHGDRADYGHVDLLVGHNAPSEIYPMVLDFVEECDT